MENKMNEFTKFKIDLKVIEALSHLKITKPTQVQEQVIPSLQEKNNTVVVSKTGSGKTASYAIPILSDIDWQEKQVHALVIVPTRELALQVSQEFSNIGRLKRIRCACLFGKESFESQVKQLRNNPQVVVATPGRLLDHLDYGSINLKSAKYLIIDEADEMLNMGFIDDVKDVLNDVSPSCVKGLFSATMPTQILQLIEKYIEGSIKIEISDKNDQIVQQYVLVKQDERLKALKKILHHYNPESCIIFANTQEDVNWLYDELLEPQKLGAKLHGDLLQKQRIQTIEAFKCHKFRYLVATDVAARGLDISEVSLIVNFELPEDLTRYIHRIGRSGRYLSQGHTVSIVEKHELGELKILGEKYLQNIIEIELDSLNDTKAQRHKFKEKQENRRQVLKSKAQLFDDKIVKVYIKAGNKHKIRKTDIVGTIMQCEGINFDDIGVITLTDQATFVDVLNGKADKIIDFLSTRPIKGKVRKVSYAKQ